MTDKRLSPPDRIIANLDGDYYKLTDVAQAIGVSPTTLRRLMAKKRTKAPSHQIKRGGMVMYLYTRDDIAELKKYYSNAEKVRERRVDFTPESDPESQESA